jgi:hypothetical protein
MDWSEVQPTVKCGQCGAVNVTSLLALLWRRELIVYRVANARRRQHLQHVGQ